MKKNLLALFALGSFFSTYAQTVYVKDQAVVAVKPNTLMYMGNGLEVASSTTNTIINEGNIQINLSNLEANYPSSSSETTGYYYKNFKSDGTTVSDGGNFVNTYTSKNSYGQVMFTNNVPVISSNNVPYSTTRIQGKMTFERPYVSTASYNWLPISFPFYGSINDNASIGSVLTDTFGLTTSEYVYNDVRNNSRYNSTVMVWSDNLYRPIAYNSADLESETRTHILNLTKGKLKTIFDAHNTTTDRIQYKGTPWGLTRNIVWTNTNNSNGNGNKPWTTYYTSTETWGVWKERINQANEAYKSYIGESFTIANDASTTFGKYLTTFGNQFTHNFDLATYFAGASSSDAVKSDIKAVQKVGSSVTWNIKQGNTTAVQSTLIASVPDNTTSTDNPAIVAKQWTGDAEALLLRPFEIAQFKFSYKHLPGNPDGTNRTYQYITSDSNQYWATTPKTFNYSTSGTITTTTPIAKTANNGSNLNSVNNSNINLYQLGLVISNKDETIGNRLYFVAYDKDITGNRNEFEVDYTEYKTTTGFWANQENKDGSYDDGTYLYINGFNLNDYVAKPLHISFYKDPNDANTSYTINANLAEISTLNDNLDRLSNGNKFYFVDTKENKSFEITKDFSYTFNATESSPDRFVVY